jgi:hypothetical protein
MESGLFGIQPEASSCIAYCLILRARKPKRTTNNAVISTQTHDYVYFPPVTKHVSSKNMAEYSAVFNRYCLSDSLLEGSRSITLRLLLDSILSDRTPTHYRSPLSLETGGGVDVRSYTFGMLAAQVILVDLGTL